MSSLDTVGPSKFH